MFARGYLHWRCYEQELYWVQEWEFARCTVRRFFRPRLPI